MTRGYQPGPSPEYDFSPCRCIVVFYRDGNCVGSGKSAEVNAGSLHPYDESLSNMIWTWDQLDEWWLVNSIRVF